MPAGHYGGEAMAESQPEYLLSLQYEGAAPSSPDDYTRLYDLALEIVESSNFNSRNPQWDWDLADILRDYRRAVDGRYLLISFVKPRSVKTVGGDLTIKEILIGLNGSEYASSLHTVDDEGRIVGHAKYRGELCIELLQLVTSMKPHLNLRSSGP
jgi:hypothetical protein